MAVGDKCSEVQTRDRIVIEEQYGIHCQEQHQQAKISALVLLLIFS